MYEKDKHLEPLFPKRSFEERLAAIMAVLWKLRSRLFDDMPPDNVIEVDFQRRRRIAS